MTIPARIILSRKGFDSKYGGCASPIFPSNRLVSLPIEDEGTGIQYRNIPMPRGAFPALSNLGEVVDALSGCNVNSHTDVHLDPDIRRGLHSAHNQVWKPLFGQSKAALGHLRRQEVGHGDLFLFFGWFRAVHAGKKGKLEYVPRSADQHVIWGWMEVDYTIDPFGTVPEWASHHPHAIIPHGLIYVGADRLNTLPGITGAGVFDEFREPLLLTHPDRKRERSYWRLPSFFRNAPRPFTYHRNAHWEDEGDCCCMSSAKIGQEFVLHTAGIEPAVERWLRNVFHAVPRKMAARNSK